MATFLTHAEREKMRQEAEEKHRDNPMPFAAALQRAEVEKAEQQKGERDV